MFNTIMEVFGQEVARGPHDPAGQRRSNDALQKIGNARILLVEDNEINQQIATEILTNAAMHVSPAINGQKAADMIQADEFDVVLMDIQMPVMDGYTATREIRKGECGMRSEKGKNSDLKSEIRNQKCSNNCHDGTCDDRGP